MSLNDITALIFIILTTTFPLLVAYRLYHLQGKKLYLLFILYDGLGKAFFLVNFFGRHLIDNVLYNNASTTHTQIVVGLLINFIAYPFLGFSGYFFASYLTHLCDRKPPAFFKWPYILWISTGMIFFIFLLKEVADAKIQSWDYLSNDTGILIGNLVFYLFFYLAIFLLFRYSKHILPDRKKTAIQFLGYYYFAVYSFLFLSILPGHRYFRVDNTILFIIIFSFNIPVVIYFRYYLSILFKRPSIHTIGELQAYYAPWKITKREAEIIAFVCQGKTNREISDLLFLSLQTIKNALYTIYKKIGVSSRAGLINSYYKEKKS